MYVSSAPRFFQEHRIIKLPDWVKAAWHGLFRTKLNFWARFVMLWSSLGMSGSGWRVSTHLDKTKTLQRGVTILSIFSKPYNPEFWGPMYYRGMWNIISDLAAGKCPPRAHYISLFVRLLRSFLDIATFIHFIMRTTEIVTICLSIISVGAVDPIVDLSYSKYKGTALPRGVTHWLGIRYAVWAPISPFSENWDWFYPSPGTAPWLVAFCSTHSPKLQFNCSEG